MIVKVYLPRRLYNSKKKCELYGEVVIEEKSISYFIVSENAQIPDLRLLGRVCASENQVDRLDYSIVFCFDDTAPNIYLSKLNVKLSDDVNTNLFLYDERQFRCIDNETHACSEFIESGDVYLLRSLIKSQIKQSRFGFEVLAAMFFKMLARCFQAFESVLAKSGAASKIISSTTLHEHATIWRKYVMHEKFHSGHVWTVILDIFAGILITILFLHVDDPSKYFIQFSNTIILQLRSLLDSLKGSPVGLKLNVQLNNFFLDCFVYHVDLWATFLVLVSPLIHYLSVPVVVLGFFGLSFQLALLTDVIVFTSLHAQCFYIYTAVLYHVEIVGFRTLWKVVLGKRKNVLKDRVESHDYMNRQLFLATLFFAILLFLFPTVIVYYVVFAFLRTCIYFVTYTLMVMRRFILSFPIRSMVLWIFGHHMNISNIDVNLIEVAHSTLQPVYVFALEVKKSSLLGSVHFWKMDYFDNYLSVDQYLLGIFKGQMMGFTLPKTVK